MKVNLSAIPSNCWFGQVLRWPLRWIPKELAVPIIQGPLRGKRWIVGSSTHGCWLGSYEFEKQQLFEHLVGLGDTVFDIGAHAGFYTLLASVLVGPSGRVVAFEPFPGNLAYLKRHLALNRINNVTVVESAIYDSDGEVRMQETGNTSEIHIDARGPLRVAASTLDGLVFEKEFPAPRVVKVDVEGAEYKVLKGAMRLLTELRPVLFLSIHGKQANDECCNLLRKLGYTFKPILEGSVEAGSELVAEG